MATSLLLATNSPNLIPLPEWLTIPYLPPNAGTIGAVLYSGFYMLLEPFAGTCLLPLIISWTAYANHLTQTHASIVNQASIAIFAVSWILQFLGHGVYEGRAPALLDNILQALVLAPFFVFMEFLFKVFGYRPELQKRVKLAVDKEIKKFKVEQAANGGDKNGKAQ